MWSFPSTSVSQSWDYIAFRMEASHLKELCGLQSVSHWVIASRIVLPSSDVKGEKKNRTYPSTWNFA